MKDYEVIRDDEIGIEVHYKCYKGVSTVINTHCKMFTIKNADDGELMCVHNIPTINTVEDCLNALKAGLIFLDSVQNPMFQ